MPRALTLLRQIGLALPLLILVNAPSKVWAQASAAASASQQDALEVQRLIKDGQYAQALKQADDSLAKNPKDPQMRFRRGVVLSVLDRKAEALVVFQKLVEDHPEMPAPYNNMAVIYAAQGDYDKARSALDKAIRTNPAYSTAYQNLGDVYAQLASQAYSKALQLDKTDGTVQPKLALLRELTSGPNTAPTTVAAAKTEANVAVAPPAKQNVSPTPAKTAPTVVAAVTPEPVNKTSPTTPTPPKTPAAAADGVAEVESAVKAWAAAWSKRDMSAYIDAYTSDFNGQAKTHKAWEDERRARIVGRKNISVEVADLRISVNGNRAQAHFRQSYQSDSLTVNSRKTLDLVRSAKGKWLIRQESVGG